MPGFSFLRKTQILGVLLSLATIAGPATAGDDKPRERLSAVEYLLEVNGAEALIGAVLYVDEAGVLDFNLVDFLGDRDNRFVLFAPSNPAFERLLGFEPGALAGLSAEAIKDALGGLVPAADVGNILLKHVVPTETSRRPRGSEAALLAVGSALAADGSELTVGIGNTGVTVNASTIIKSDVRTRNAVIHFIDTVL